MVGEYDFFQIKGDLENVKGKVNCYVSSDVSHEPSLSIITTEARCLVESLKTVHSTNFTDEVFNIDDENIMDPPLWTFGGEVRETDLFEPEWDADVSDVVESLKSQTVLLPMISTRTFARPKKARSSLSCLVETTHNQPPPAASPAAGIKLRRRLTATIEPSPNLIPHLEHLAKAGNRPVSVNGEEQRWEDGAAEAEAETTLTPRTTRPVVPASLLQRLQELKNGNIVTPNFKTNGPFRPPPSSTVSGMSVSQLLREIPDQDSMDKESFLSIIDGSLIGSLDGDIDRRLTLAGLILQPAKGRNQGPNTNVPTGNLIGDHFNETFTFDQDVGSGDKETVDKQHFVTNCTFDAIGANDENLNQDVQKAVTKLLGYSSQVFDSSFTVNKDVHKAFSQTSELMNSINKTRVATDIKIEDVKQGEIETNIEERLQVEAVSDTKKTEAKHLEYSSATYSRARSSKLTTFRGGIPKSPFFKSQENLRGRTSRASSHDNLERSPARSDDGIRSNLPRSDVSRETLILSPAPSEGAIDKPLAHGTYTRNSPVERYVSEDEQMSTTSDHSSQSRESIDEFPNSNSAPRKKYHVSTPILADISRHSEDWQVSPISIARAKTSVTPIRTNGHASASLVAKKLGSTPAGPVPLKQPLIQPTNNFKRAFIKKSVPSATIKNPSRPEPMTPRNATRLVETSLMGTTRPIIGGSNLPKPSKLPGRLPVRTSSIPQPRPSVSK